MCYPSSVSAIVERPRNDDSGARVEMIERTKRSSLRAAVAGSSLLDERRLTGLGSLHSEKLVCMCRARRAAPADLPLSQITLGQKLKCK